RRRRREASLRPRAALHPHIELPKPGLPVIDTGAPSNRIVTAGTGSGHACPPVVNDVMSFCVPASSPLTFFTLPVALSTFLPPILVFAGPGSSCDELPVMG